MATEQFYFPNKVVNYVNFPELRGQRENIQAILDYSLRAQVALADYNEARYDRIDLNMEELQANITLCRSVSDALGLASNVCFDILLEIRSVQEMLQQLVYLKRVTGTNLIGLPTNTTSEDDGGAF